MMPGSQGLSPTYEQAHAGSDLLTLALMPADCSVLRTPTILPDRSIKVGLSSHFYAPIGAGHKAFHPPMSKLMWVQTF